MPRDIIQNYLVSEAAKTKLSRSFSFTNTFKSLLLSLLSWALCHILSQRRFTVPTFVSRFAKVSSMSCVWAEIKTQYKGYLERKNPCILPPKAVPPRPLLLLHPAPEWLPSRAFGTKRKKQEKTPSFRRERTAFDCCFRLDVLLRKPRMIALWEARG